jgi:hypothetical protein
LPGIDPTGSDRPQLFEAFDRVPAPFSGYAHSLRTMLEVLRFPRDDTRVGAIDAAGIALTFFSHPVSITRYNRKLTVHRPGTATGFFLSLIDEIDAACFRPSFAALEPRQIRRDHWQLLYLAFELAPKPLYLFSSDQVAQANEEAAKTRRRGLGLFALLMGPVPSSPAKALWNSDLYTDWSTAGPLHCI